MASTARIDGSSAASVYFADRSGRIWELAWHPSHSPRWMTRHITATAAGKATSSASRALASCELQGGAAGIYFLDATGHVWELMGRPDDGWVLSDITARAEGHPPPAGATSALSCFSVDGQGPHVYYTDKAGHIWELVRHEVTSTWLATDVTGTAAGDPPPAAPHSLACHGADGGHPRVYFQDGMGNGHLWELAWWEYVRHWLATDITTAAESFARDARTPA